MSTRKSVIFGGAVVAGGQGIGQMAAFARNIIIARLLSPNDIGVAAIFAMTVSFLEMVSDLNANMLLIQADDGDDPRLQHTVHSIGVLRGLITSVMLFAAAGPTAWLFNVSHAKWALQVLALVPLIRSFAHSDVGRLQRRMVFLPATAAEAGGQLVAAAVAWWVATAIRSYAAVLCLTILQACVSTVISHLFAQRRFSLGWSVERVRRVFGFGSPLLVNSLLLFAVFQGDRVVIGTADRVFGTKYGLADLAVYFLAFTLTSVPVTLPLKVGGSVFFPVLSRVHRDQGEFCRKFRLVVQLYVVAAVCLTLPLMICGSRLAVAIYGHAYEGCGPIVGWLAAMQGVRLVRASLTMGAIARGDCTFSVRATALRLISLPAALLVAALGGQLVWIAVASCAAECVALLFSISLLRRRHSIPAAPSLHALAIGAVAVAAAFVASRLAGATAVREAAVGVISVAASIGAFVACLEPLRSQASGTLAAAKRRWWSAATSQPGAAIRSR